MDKKKILIIKTGYSEILDRGNNSRVVSLGDVFRTTPLLHLYKNNHITWVTGTDAMPLLKDNPFIDELLPYDFITSSQLESEEFDIVINLEKVPGICALADKVRARRSRYGFTFNSQTGKAEAYEKSSNVLLVSSNLDLKKINVKPAQELLFKIVGKKWKGEEYILGYKPNSPQEEYDVGLNPIVGTKWPTKKWPIKNWDNLEEKLVQDGLKVTRQDKQPERILSNLNNYIDWINSSRVFVSTDSLGLHLALALKKKVLGLFGPTSHKEFFFYGLGKAIIPPKNIKCVPCFSDVCKNEKNCMDYISCNNVYNEVNKFFEDRKRNDKP